MMELVLIWAILLVITLVVCMFGETARPADPVLEEKPAREREETYMDRVYQANRGALEAMVNTRMDWVMVSHAEDMGRELARKGLSLTPEHWEHPLAERTYYAWLRETEAMEAKAATARRARAKRMVWDWYRTGAKPRMG